MASQLSKKAALPLAKILATCRNNVSNTGPRTAVTPLHRSYCILALSHWYMHLKSQLPSPQSSIYLSQNFSHIYRVPKCVLVIMQSCAVYPIRYSYGSLRVYLIVITLPGVSWFIQSIYSLELGQSFSIFQFKMAYLCTKCNSWKTLFHTKQGIRNSVQINHFFQVMFFGLYGAKLFVLYTPVTV